MDLVTILSLVFTAIGAVAAVAQLEKIGWVGRIKIPLIGFGNNNLDPSLAAISSLLSKITRQRVHLNYEVRNIQTITELKKLWEIDAEAYGEASLNYQTFQEWWLAYQKGLYAIFIDGEVVGALGIWPATKKWTDELSSGISGEKDLPIDAIKRAGERGTDHWYISGLVIKKQLKRSAAVPVLLKEATLGWAIDSKLKHPVNLSAIAISDDGEKLLSRYGFNLVTPGNKMIGGYSLYSKEVGRSDILNLIQMHDTSKQNL